jgi:hypothetical protein
MIGQEPAEYVACLHHFTSTTRRHLSDYPFSWSDESQAVERGPASLVFDSFKLDVGQLTPRHDESREGVHHCHLLLGHLNPAPPVHGYH